MSLNSSFNLPFHTEWSTLMNPRLGCETLPSAWRGEDTQARRAAAGEEAALLSSSVKETSWTVPTAWGAPILQEPPLRKSQILEFTTEKNCRSRQHKTELEFIKIRFFNTDLSMKVSRKSVVHPRARCAHLRKVTNKHLSNIHTYNFGGSHVTSQGLLEFFFSFSLSQDKWNYRMNPIIPWVGLQLINDGPQRSPKVSLY